MIIARATIIFAPEEIPSTYGPAIGLEKNVCNKNPERASAPPRIPAIRTRGRRIFQIIFICTCVPFFRNRIRKISGTEICTFPVLMFSTTIMQKTAASTAKTHIYLVFLFQLFFIPACPIFFSVFYFTWYKNVILLSSPPVSIRFISVISSPTISVA